MPNVDKTKAHLNYDCSYEALLIYSTHKHEKYYTYTCTVLRRLCRVGHDEIGHDTYISSRDDGIAIVISLRKEISHIILYYIDVEYINLIDYSNI